MAIAQSTVSGAGLGAKAGTMIAPGIGTAIGAGVGALAGLGVGLSQYAKGKKLESETVRPEYEIPQEVFQNLNQAQQMALQGLPAEQKAQYIQNLQQSGQFALSQMGSRKAGLAGVSQLHQQQQSGYQNLLTQDAAARQQNQMGLMQQRQNVAGFRDQAFQFNQVNPYYEDVAKAQGLMGSGIQNIGTAVGNIGYQGGQAYDAYQQNQGPGYNPPGYNDPNVPTQTIVPAQYKNPSYGAGLPNLGAGSYPQQSLYNN